MMTMMEIMPTTTVTKSLPARLRRVSKDDEEEHVAIKITMKRRKMTKQREQQQQGALSGSEHVKHARPLPQHCAKELQLLALHCSRQALHCTGVRRHC